MSDDLTAYVSLWRACITQRLADATTAKFHGEHVGSWPRLRAEAQSWFLTPAEDFEPTCEAADLDPRKVRQLALQKIRAYNSSQMAA